MSSVPHRSSTVTDITSRRRRGVTPAIERIIGTVVDDPGPEPVADAIPIDRHRR